MKNCKQKKIRIIGGNWRSRLIPVLNVQQLRPSPNRVRETLFNWLGQQLINCTCVDLFAGSGILGFEAVSRGAKSVIMVEKNKLIYDQLLSSAKLLGAYNINIILGDALHISKRLPQAHFDIVFLDPPFHSGFLRDAIIQASFLVKQNGALYIETNEKLESHFEINKQIWQCFHQAKAGKVFYHLFRQIHSNFAK